MKLAQFIERHPYRFVAIMEAVVVIAHRRDEPSQAGGEMIQRR